MRSLYGLWVCELSGLRPSFVAGQPLNLNVRVYNKEYILSNVVDCNSIEEVRSNIDRIDRQIVALLAERGGFVKQAVRFKNTTDDVKAPQRVEQVIAKVTALSQELGANSSVTEQVYRAMISGFINAELAEHTALNTSGVKP